MLLYSFCHCVHFTLVFFIYLFVCLMKEMMWWHVSVHYACIYVDLCAAKVLFSWTMYSAGL